MEMWWWVFHSPTWTLHLIHQHRLQRPSSRRRWTSIRVPTRKIYHVSYIHVTAKYSFPSPTHNKQFCHSTNKSPSFFAFSSVQTHLSSPYSSLLFQFSMCQNVTVFFCLSIELPGFYIRESENRRRRCARRSKKNFTHIFISTMSWHKVCWAADWKKNHFNFGNEINSFQSRRRLTNSINHDGTCSLRHRRRCRRTRILK